MRESPETYGCINAENLQDTTGSPGGDTSKSLENINYLFISLVLTLLVLFFSGTYFHDDKITIYCVCLPSWICQANAGFFFKNSQTCLYIIPNLSKTAKSVEVGASEN